MGIFHFGKKKEERLEITELLEGDDNNKIVIEMDDRISELCSYGDDLSKLTSAQKTFFFNQEFEREMNNGGFYSFFTNSSGRFSNQAVASLKEIGAHKTACLLQKAIAQFPDSKVPTDDEKRNILTEEVYEKAEKLWSGLDEKFYDYEDDLNTLNVKYIKSNKQFFL